MELQAERAADVGRDHPQLLLAEPDRVTQERAEQVRDLRRRPERHLLRSGVPVGEKGAPLERQGVEAAVVESLREDPVGLRERPIDVPVLELDVGEAVRLGPVVQERRVLRQGLLGVHDDG